MIADSIHEFFRPNRETEILVRLKVDSFNLLFSLRAGSIRSLL